MGTEFVWVCLNLKTGKVDVYGEQVFALTAIAGKPKQHYRITKQKVNWR